MEGGDTDTNACIVGGLIGAAVGCNNIPELYRVKMLGYSAKQASHNRPKYLVPKESSLMALIDAIYEKTEKTVTIVDGIEDVAKPTKI